MNKLVHVLSDNEEKVLDDLIAFNRQYENVFFKDKRDDQLLEIIDNVIEEKLKSINGFLAFKFLNRIWAKSDEYPISLEAKIINGFDCDLALNRLSILLLDIVTNDINFFNYYDYCGGRLNIFLENNFFSLILDKGIKSNYFLMLDSSLRFIGLVNSSKDIPLDKKEEIVNIYLFLYKDIYKESKRFNITESSCNVLAKRFDTYEKGRIYSDTILKREVVAVQLYNIFFELLSIEDSEIDDEILESFKLSKILINSLLASLNSFELEKILDYYEEIKKEFDLNKCSKALKLINKTINKKRNN